MTDPRRRLPRFYLPREMLEREAEVLCGAPPAPWPRYRLLPGHGPDLAADGTGGGGVVIGAPYDPGGSWARCEDGAWLDWTAADPTALRRPAHLPGTLVRGTLPGHAWQAPRLCVPVETLNLHPDLEATGWTDDHLAPALARLPMALHLLRTVDPLQAIPDSWAVMIVEAAAYLLELNYCWVTAERLRLTGWIDQRMAIDVIAAALRLTPGPDDRLLPVPAEDPA